MPVYHHLGQLPPKRHTVFKSPAGAFYYEQLFGTVGFDGMSSLLYHLHRPTQVKAVLDSVDLRPSLAVEHNIMSRKLIGFDVAPADDFLQSRTPLLVNNDVVLGVAAPRQSLTDYFYKNADADELLFIHRGTGTLRTLLGQISFVPGDYLLIPRGMIYQISFDETTAAGADSVGNRLFYLESTSPIYTPKRYRNHFGQQLEHSPYSERDLKLPQNLETHDEQGEFVLKIKKEGILHALVYDYHPFDVVGWDGYNFPYGISIHDFEPITGRIHQPPPVHQMFETKACVVCSFVPRLFDYHPQAIPAPYNHSNIDSDEVLYYVDGNFMSRNGIGPGVLTLHPGGIPHGPHPGAMERSIGKTGTDELAVMVDTFRPLRLTTQAMGIDDGVYFQSWREQ
ncbi:homogentisate 1,2-dioxygenase [Fibrella sp. HMF5335]|uniref:Homogentisate 1,2-dioxygenase n=1 Tax=Fibrella rubiginis TaxID=2817060 RepID=A0A939K587_9BACT|nr:homogentisate 1,2-dioxygenase [Fibrella rubiginis]MBO0936205.1 homogentisate 1,2-dioxygenase [Fibrella rubiginis]